MGQFVTVYGKFVDMNDVMIFLTTISGVMYLCYVGREYRHAVCIIIGMLCLRDNLAKVGSQTFYSYSNICFGTVVLV